MDLSNASLLDEATAAAEAMTLLHRSTKGKKGDRFFVDRNCFPQTIAVLENTSRAARPRNRRRRQRRHGRRFLRFDGAVPRPTRRDPRPKSHHRPAHTRGPPCVVAADILALTVLEAPGTLGADVVVGSTQRFGVPIDVRRTPRRVHGRDRRPQAVAARTPGRRVDRHRRTSGTAPRTPDTRATHSARKGHV